MEPNITVSSNLPTTNGNDIQSKRDRSLATLISLTVVMILILIVLILSYSVFVNRTVQSNDQDTTETSVTPPSINTQTTSMESFVLKTKLLNSDTYTDNLFQISFALPSNSEVSFTDDTGLAIKKDNTDLIFQTSAEDSGFLYETTPQVTTLSHPELGTLYRISLSQGVTSQYLEERFNAEGPAWHFYTNQYSEIGCGAIFDPTTGTNSPAKACGNNSINFTSTNNASSLLSVYCVNKDETTASVCDEMIQEVSMSVY